MSVHLDMEIIFPIIFFISDYGNISCHFYMFIDLVIDKNSNYFCISFFLN